MLELLLQGRLWIRLKARGFKSLKNKGGGYLSRKRTIRQVKIDAVQRVLEQLAAPEADDSANVNERMARLGALMKRASD